MIYDNDYDPVLRGLTEGIVQIDSFARVEGGLRLDASCLKYTQVLVVTDEFVPILFNLLGIKEDEELMGVKKDEKLIPRQMHVCLAEFPRGIVGVRHHIEPKKWMLWPN